MMLWLTIGIWFIAGMLLALHVLLRVHASNFSRWAEWDTKHRAAVQRDAMRRRDARDS